MATSDRQYIWKAIIIGIFFVSGLFAGLHIQDPAIQVLQTLTNMTSNTPVHTAEVNNLHSYIFISILLTALAAIAVLFILGIFGGVSIVAAYSSGVFISHHAYAGFALLIASWLCLWYGNERRKKGQKLFIIF